MRYQRYFSWLIFFSLALLAVFEGTWLRNIWKEQRESLAQETDYIFQKTVSRLQDTLLRRNLSTNIIPQSGDSLKIVLHAQTPAAAIRVDEPEGLPAVMTHQEITRYAFNSVSDSAAFCPDTSTGKLRQVRLIISSPNDAAFSSAGMSDVLFKMGSPETNRIVDGEWTLQISRDSISMETLRESYSLALAATGIFLDFIILSTNQPPPEKGFSTSPAFAGLFLNNVYRAHFSEYQQYLLRKILPYALFALFLFGITTAAFALVYNSLRQQQKLTQLKNEFISNITHELKTPITTVGVALEALGNFDVLQKPEQAREYLSISRLELDRLSLLVDKVLRLSMFEQQELRMKKEPLEVEKLVAQVIAAMRLQAEHSGAQIDFETPGSANFRLEGDRIHLAGVVFNLIDNALKYRAPGRNPQLFVRLEKRDQAIVLQVRDNGLGIPQAYQDKIFDKFFRVPSGNIHNVKGHGLGLSYVGQVVAQHGGKVWVDSTEGEGSVFTVELPAD